MTTRRGILAATVGVAVSVVTGFTPRRGYRAEGKTLMPDDVAKLARYRIVRLRNCRLLLAEPFTPSPGQHLDIEDCCFMPLTPISGAKLFDHNNSGWTGSVSHCVFFGSVAVAGDTMEVPIR